MRKLAHTICIVACCFALASCGPAHTRSADDAYVMPPELKGCKIFKLYPEMGGVENILYVIRCPEGVTTAYKSGKSPLVATTMTHAGEAP